MLPAYVASPATAPDKIEKSNMPWITAGTIRPPATRRVR